jgi:hypothetical protein
MIGSWMFAILSQITKEDFQKLVIANAPNKDSKFNKTLSIIKTSYESLLKLCTPN